MKHTILVWCAALALACTSHAAEAQTVKLRYGQNAAGAKGLSSLPLNVAIRNGYFAREGIDLVVVNIPGGTDRIVAALDNGEIDAGKNATPYLIQAVLKGSDAVAVVSQTTNPVYSLIVRHEIKSFADLKGKTIALSTPGDTITLATTRLLAARGLGPRDYVAKPVVGTPARFNCLVSGECAAVPMGQPEDFVAINSAGFPRLAFTYEAGADLIFNVDMVRRAWGNANKDTVVRFVRAFAAAYEFMNDPRNRDAVVGIVVEGGVAEGYARQIYAPYLDPSKNVLPRRGELDMGAFARVTALMADANVIPKSETAPEKFVDLQYLKAAGIQ